MPMTNEQWIAAYHALREKGIVPEWLGLHRVYEWEPELWRDANDRTFISSHAAHAIMRDAVRQSAWNKAGPKGYVGCGWYTDRYMVQILNEFSVQVSRGTGPDEFAATCDALGVAWGGGR